VALPPSTDLVVSLGDELVVSGFSTIDRGIDTQRFQMIGRDGVAHAWKLSPAAPEGFSGALAYLDQTVAGLLVVRNLSQGHTFMYGHGKLAEFCRSRVSGALTWSNTAVHPLRRYPLGPFVPLAVVLQHLPDWDRLLATLYRGREAVAVESANAARLECGPAPKPGRGLLEPIDYPDPTIDRPGFWLSALRDGGLQSPRLLAALITLPDDDQLDQRARSARDGFLETLSTWT
jgi:hypothetical protein